MVDHSKLNIHDLASFGVKTFTDTYTAYSSGAIGAQGNIAIAVLGQVGSSEAQAFSAYYQSYVLDALRQFLRDSPIGIEALGTGATVMAANYHAGDRAQADSLDRVNEVFQPGPGQPSIATDARHVPSTKGTGKSTGGKLPPPDRSDTGSSGDRQRDRWRSEGSGENVPPQEQVQEHNKLYQKDETWTPVPLPKYHPDVPVWPPNHSSAPNTYED